MLSEINRFPLIPSWLRNRAVRLWARNPMVAVLALALIAVAAQECFGDGWCKLLFVGFTTAALGALLHSRLRPGAFSLWPAASITLGMALFFSFFHSLAQSDARRRLDSWEQSIRELSRDDQLKAASWNPVAFRGTIDSALRYRKATFPNRNQDPNGVGWQTITTVRVAAIRSSGAWESKSLVMPLSVDGRIEGLYPGDQVEVYGQWRLPSKPANPGQFDQSRRYAELGYGAQSRAESERQVQRREPAERTRLDRYLAMVSATALRAIERYVVLGQAELTAALVLGQREQAEWSLQEELLATGTIHMLSISGMHIEMVALSLLYAGMLLQIPRRPLLVGICLVVIGYGLLCGANPPVARATIMLTGLCVARWMGWTFSSLNFLAFAGVLLILYRTTVVFETGTQLSFMAVTVLILSTDSQGRRLTPLEKLIEARSSALERGLRRVLRWSADMLRTSFWVWFITAPLVWTAFHVISPIAILLNLALWLPMLVALVSGLGLIVVGWLPVVAWPLGLMCGGSLWLVEGIVGYGESIPLGHFWLRSPPVWWLYGFYALGITMAIGIGVKRPGSRKRLMLTLGVWFAFGLLIRPASDWYQQIATGDQGKFCLTFIDVGHGTSIYVETPDHERWLYDAGRMGDHQRSYQVMVEALWAMNCSRIDGLLLSHADSDHYNGIDGITKRFKVSQLISTSQVFVHSSPLLQQTLKSTRARGVRHVVWRKGDFHEGRGWSMLALHPPEHGVNGSDNSNSLCILLEVAGRRILLPGDLEPPGMQMLVAQPTTKVDVLMAPHHGSMNSKSEELLQWCYPTTVVISGSTRAVSKKVLDSFAAADREVLVTARDHAIRIEIACDGTMTKLHWVIDHWERWNHP